MEDEEDIKWVTLTLDFTPEQEAKLEEFAKAAGMPVKCYCLHVLYRHLLEGASAEEKERWEREFPATLRRNGCEAA